MAELKSLDSSQVKFQVVEPPNMPNVYANHIHVQWTNHDMRVRFGELVKIEDPTAKTPKTFTIENRVAITMAWTEAKYFLSVLTDLIRKYEAINGEIKQPQAPG
jgi:hypothetical protein